MRSLKRLHDLLAPAPVSEEVRPGQFFVLVDLSVAGGKLVSQKIYRGTKGIDKEAAKLNDAGRNVQVIDAMWFKPAREILKKTGMIDESKRNYSLTDFQVAAVEVDDAIKEAFRKGHVLKAMWDTFEEIPTKQKPLYDRLMKILGMLDKPGQEAYQLRMELRRYG